MSTYSLTSRAPTAWAILGGVLVLLAVFVIVGIQCRLMFVSAFGIRMAGMFATFLIAVLAFVLAVHLLPWRFYEFDADRREIYVTTRLFQRFVIARTTISFDQVRSVYLNGDEGGRWVVLDCIDGGRIDLGKCLTYQKTMKLLADTKALFYKQG